MINQIIKPITDQMIKDKVAKMNNREVARMAGRSEESTLAKLLVILVVVSIIAIDYHFG